MDKAVTSKQSSSGEQAVNVHYITPWLNYDCLNDLSAEERQVWKRRIDRVLIDPDIISMNGARDEHFCEMVNIPVDSDPAEIEAHKIICHLLSHLVQDNLRRDEVPKELNPNHFPDPALDVAEYVQSWNGTYRRHVEQISCQIDALSPTCVISVCIPVAAHEEQKYVYEALRCFCGQTLPPENFELVILANSPYDLMAETSETVQEIARFKNDFPRINTQIMQVGLLGSPLQTIGFIRALLHDVVVLRHGQRQNDRDHIMVRCDADTRAIGAYYLENFLKRFKQNPQTDSFAGWLCSSPEAALDDPLIFISQRLFDIVYSGRRVCFSIPSHGGPNHAIKASVYAKLGGYYNRSVCGEDLNLYKRHLKWRQGSSDFVAVGHGGWRSRLYTSSRRGNHSCMFGGTYASQWSNQHSKFGVNNNAIRKKDERSGQAFAPVDNSVLRLQAEQLINATLKDMNSFWPEITAASKPVSKALTLHLGISYHLTGDNSIVIDSIDEFLARYQQFRDDQLKTWRERMSLQK